MKTQSVFVSQNDVRTLDMQSMLKLDCKHDRFYWDRALHVIMLPAESTDHLGGPYACSPGGEIFLLIPLHLSKYLGMRLRGYVVIHKMNTNGMSGRQNTHMPLHMFKYLMLGFHNICQNSCTQIQRVISAVILEMLRLHKSQFPVYIFSHALHVCTWQLEKGEKVFLLVLCRVTNYFSRN